MSGIIAATVIAGCAGPNSPSNTLTGAITLVSTTRTPGWAEDVCVWGDSAFVADNDRGIVIYDVSNIAGPVLKDTIATFKKATLVRYLPTLQKVIVSEGRIAGYDLVSEAIDFNAYQGDAADFYASEVGDGQIFVAEVDKLDGFRYVTFYRDPIYGWLIFEEKVVTSNPNYVSFLGLCVDSVYVYIAHGEYGVDIYQVNYLPGGDNLATFLGNVDTPGAAYDLAITPDGNHLVVADYQNGIQIVDVTDKSNPKLMGSLLPDGVDAIIKICVQDDIAYFIDQHNGIFAADVRDFNGPELTAIFDSPEPKSLFVTADHTIYLADEDLGLMILKWR